MTSLNYTEFLEYIKKNGITLAKTTKSSEIIPEGTLLYFGVDTEHDRITTYNSETGNLNHRFKYRFDYCWSSRWEKYYDGLFIIEEPVVIDGLEYS
jgi:hypothetical protein